MSRARPPLLPAAIFATALGAVAALTLPVGRLLPAALWHMVFALGALPMILLAMAHFIPVLTRGSAAPQLVAVAPLCAFGAGLGILGWFVFADYPLRLASPWAAFVAVAGFAGWLAIRWKTCLGRPHPGLAWYAAALGLLATGLAAVGVSPFWQEQARALRIFHLHINTLGFIGLTALGTLQVLLPTVAGKPDPGAALRLKQDLAWSGVGALAIASGAAWFHPLAVGGTIAYAWPVLRLLFVTWRNWRDLILKAGTTLPLLAAAIVGLSLAIGDGVLHARGILCGPDATALFVVGFLLPLVSGAAGQLLPVWLRPGVQSDWHRAGRAFLARGARLRGLLLVAGGALAALGQTGGYIIGIAMAAWLAVSMLVVGIRRT